MKVQESREDTTAAEWRWDSGWPSERQPDPHYRSFSWFLWCGSVVVSWIMYGFPTDGELTCRNLSYLWNLMHVGRPAELQRSISDDRSLGITVFFSWVNRRAMRLCSCRALLWFTPVISSVDLDRCVNHKRAQREEMETHLQRSDLPFGLVFLIFMSDLWDEFLKEVSHGWCSRNLCQAPADENTFMTYISSFLVPHVSFLSSFSLLCGTWKVKRWKEW